MEIYLVPFSLADMVLLSPFYGFVAWLILKKTKHPYSRFSGYISWSFIIHATLIPVFWFMHYIGWFKGVEANPGQFDPVNVTGHVGGFFFLYFLITGMGTIGGLIAVKWSSRFHI